MADDPRTALSSPLPEQPQSPPGRETMPQEKVESFGKEVRLSRPGQPAGLTGAYVYLASNEASYVTVAVIPVMGGRPTL